MSETAQLALIAAIIPTIAAIAAAVLSVMTLLKSNENGTKSDAIIQKSDVIHTLTNSRLTEVTAQLAVANEKIEGLQKLVSQMMEAEKATNLAAERSTLQIERAAAQTPPMIADKLIEDAEAPGQFAVKKLTDRVGVDEANLADTRAELQDKGVIDPSVEGAS